jgi:hypothetical protein
MFIFVKLDTMRIRARTMVEVVAKIGNILPPAGKSFDKIRK